MKRLLATLALGAMVFGFTGTQTADAQVYYHHHYYRSAAARDAQVAREQAAIARADAANVGHSLSYDTWSFTHPNQARAEYNAERANLRRQREIERAREAYILRER